MGRTKANTRGGLAGHINSEHSRTEDGKNLNSGPKRRKGGNPNSSDIRPSKRNKTNRTSSNESPSPEEIHETASENESSIKPPAAASANVPPPYGNLTTTHDVLPMHIISSSQIEKKVTSALKQLANFPAVPPAKPAVIMLHSKAKTASKMISIVEIAKREIASNGGKWFQYNSVDQTIEPKKVQKPESKSGIDKSGEVKGPSEVDASGDPESDQDEEAFETMKTPFERAIEDIPKIRAVPTMTTYLSRVRIESLRKKYGYVGQPELNIIMKEKDLD
ncbi:uncharacterized protein BP5553_05339 [Venustampulla echinocandica]|uniref:DNA/RNA-binding protein Alba-like domain-containing protein n=1 Tax=Venustampulla echinocandica TaxID=2656787 RepID=A0A370TQT8_9HELO|nr:uncharacterized protein BP5553_05339 [Venustampulla echinocandica]RDL37906.1 hypothetical protein BP5553_05339 [Venustampulla echinocandica]